jgi:hypothetical protein
VEDGAYRYRLTQSKTDQAGTEHNPDADKPIVGPAAAALSAWLDVANLTSSALFHRIRGSTVAEPLSGYSGQAVWSDSETPRAARGLEGD